MLSFGENNGTGASIFTLPSPAFWASMVFHSLRWAYYVGVVNSAQASDTENLKTPVKRLTNRRAGFESRLKRIKVS